MMRRKKHTVPKQKKRNTRLNFWKKLRQTPPNNMELTLLGLITWLQLPYKYVGNAAFIINGKSPDFVHNTEPKLIELFGERWHSKREEVDRTAFFAKSGYETLVIWGKETQYRNRNKLVKKLLDFEEVVSETSEDLS